MRASVLCACLYLVCTVPNAGAAPEPAATPAGTAAAGAADPEPAPDDSTAFTVVAGDTLWLTQPIDVVGSRVPAALPGVIRVVDVLDRSDLDELPARSTPELLATSPSVVVSQRQQYGVQADLSVRGSTFEQVEVLLDGIEMGDPQTGHHLMNLPLSADDIARIEVLRGHGSALYGANACGGTVNVVPKSPTDAQGGRLSVTGGGNDTYGIGAAFDLADPSRPDDPRVRLSGSRFRTLGHRPGTDADIWTATARASLDPRDDADVFLGFASRAFGAEDFYAPYPSFERTETAYAAARWRGGIGARLTVEPRVYLRRHGDEFVLVRDRPQIYTNRHTTRLGGAELRTVYDAGRHVAVAAGVEGVYDDIHSVGIRGGSYGPALGDHLRRRASFSLEAARQADPLRWQVGGRLDLRSEYAPRLSESAAAAWGFADGVTLRASAGTTFRVPTYTELYYEDPANRGDSRLRPEEGWTWDAGLQADRTRWSASTTFFSRREDDLIDWRLETGVADVDGDGDVDADDRLWQVANFASGTTRGLETVAVYRTPAGHRFSVSHTYLDKSVDYRGETPKYGSLVPEHVLVAEAAGPLVRRLNGGLLARWIRRPAGETADRGYFVLDGRVALDAGDRWSLTLQVTNLLDEDYEEIPGLPMPGRLASVTTTARF